MTLQDAWKHIAVRGPAAILVDRHGNQMLPDAALKAGIGWDILYIREDGWSLGASFYLAQYAERLHRDQWIGWMRRGDKKPCSKTFG